MYKSPRDLRRFISLIFSFKMRSDVHVIVFVTLSVSLATADPQFPGVPFGALRPQFGGFAPVAQQAAQAVQTIPAGLSKLKELLILPNLDCGCSGYEAKAKQCDWPEVRCNLISPSFLNFLFWCNSLNTFREAKRLGTVKNTYVQSLSCLSNLSLLERQLTQLGLTVPENVVPKPLPVDALPTSDVGTPPSINWSSKMSAVRNQGKCASCYAFSSVALCEWYLSNSNARSAVALSVSCEL